MSEPASSTPLRIGALGAARITPMALIAPAREHPAIEIRAVAARDRERAERFAKRHDIPCVHSSYDSLLADPEIDAIYNPLPNSHHCEWTIRALEAGKHVLCEKPFASNADEARSMADAAEQSGLALMEAFHWRYHPLTARLLEIIASGEIGGVRHIEATMCVPLLIPGDIRYRHDLSGGATMDVGAYTVNAIRVLAGDEPQVVSAEARLSSPGVDRWLRADLRFPGGGTARITHSMCSLRLLSLSARVTGESGELRVFNPFAPHFYNRVTVTNGAGRRRERVPGRSTYWYQLGAFERLVTQGTPVPSDPSDAIANMVVIDEIYEKVGLGRRGSAPREQ